MKKISIGVLIASFFMLIFLMMSMLMAIGGSTTTSAGPSGPVVPSESEQAFIEAVAPIAQETFKEYGIFPSVTLAQAILESSWGQSGLATEGNNLFGIKADESWTGPVIEMVTSEEVNGGYITIVARWRVYDKWEDSVLDHGKFLKENSRYEEAGVFVAKNYREQIEAIKRAGYATDSLYVDKVCSVIESYELHKYDN